MEYVLHVLIMIGIYVILSSSLNLVTGHTGLLSVSHAAFFAIGAYSAALLGLRMGAPFSVIILVAIVCAGVLGVLIGLPSLRLHDDYFVIATFAFQVIVYNVLNNWVSVTGGPMGMPGVPSPHVFGLKISSGIGFLVLVFTTCVLVLLLCRKLTASPFGRVLKSIREDEIFAEAAGKNVAYYKVTVFVISAAVAAVAGVLYGSYIGFVDPSPFTVAESIFIVSIVIIGGSGTLWGPVIGSILLIAIPEALRFVGLPSALAANIRQILFGGLLVAFLMWRPKGLVGVFGLRSIGARR